MTIVDRLRNDACTTEEAIACLESSNPIVLYAAMTYLVRNHIADDPAKKALLNIRGRLSDEDKMLGFYRIGHAAMAALLKPGVPEEQVFQLDLDPWDKETAITFAANGWQQ